MQRETFSASSRKNGNALTNTRPNATFYLFISLVLVSTLLLLLSSSSFILEFKNMGLSIFSGARGGIYKISSFVSRTVLSVKELADLKKEYNELLIQLEHYEELERSNAEIIQENIRLRNQLEFSKTLRYRRIPAQISGRDPDNLFSALIINKGSFSGVANNMTVVAWQNGTQALVGKVIQTGVFESLIMPIFDINSLVSSRFSVSRFEGIVEGQGSREKPLLMRYIPKRERDEINIGDMIISSGMGGIFPAGINIGRVCGINALEYANTLEAELEPVVDFSRLEYVFLIDADNADIDAAVEEND